METGREGDTWIAENIIGYKWLVFEFIGGDIRILTNPSLVEDAKNQTPENLVSVTEWNGIEDIEDGTDYDDLPNFTTDTVAAMLVLEIIRKNNKVAYIVDSRISILYKNLYECTIAPRNAKNVGWYMDGRPKPQTFNGFADTKPLAICRAAKVWWEATRKGVK